MADPLIHSNKNWLGIALATATAALVMSGCSPQQGGPAAGTTQKGVLAAAVALTAADNVALQYVILPLCGPTHPKPLCSEAAISAQIKSAAQTAHDAVKGAEMAGDNASVAAANAAIAALVKITPKPAA